MQKVEKSTFEKYQALFVKLDRKRRPRHGFAEIRPMNAYDLSDGEGGEEETMEKLHMLMVSLWWQKVITRQKAIRVSTWTRLDRQQVIIHLQLFLW